MPTSLPRTAGPPHGRADLKGTFTRYVRALEPRGEPGTDAFDELWQALRGVLKWELRKRSLWTSPPSFVGIYGWESWDEQDPARTETALDELLADCYTAIFVQRLPRLLNHLRRKPNVDGLVFLLIRNFLYDRQKHYDPLGFRVFDVLRCAVAEAAEAGELYVLGGQGEVRNESVLASSAGEDPATATATESLRPIVERWSDALLPELVTALGRARKSVVDRLRRRLFDLEAEGVRVVRFKDLADVLKADVRRRWSAVFDADGGESAVEEAGEGFSATVRLFRPADGLADADSFQKLLRCTSKMLEKIEEPARTRRYLEVLWGFLRTYAVGEGPEELPSNRKMATLLRIPRERFPRLFETLSSLVRSCHRRASETRPRRSL